MGRDTVVLAVNTLCVVVVSVVFVSSLLAGKQAENRHAPGPTLQNWRGPMMVGQGGSAGGGADGAKGVVGRTLPGVVGLTVHSPDRLTARGDEGANSSQKFDRDFRPRHLQGESVGSGVIVDRTGRILTNYHVIEGGETIRVHFQDGRRAKAEQVGSDPESDLAVLQLTDPPDDLQPVPFGNSDRLHLGQSVIAMGNPFGLNGTVTSGIISALGRADIGLVDDENYIQTDAAINPGNSGGALIDMEGRLVGINTAIFSATGGYQGVSFAIPSNMAESIMREIVEEGSVTRSWLGIGVEQIETGLEGSSARALRVERVAAGSPAERAGVRPGDIIISLAGQKATTSRQLKSLVQASEPGETVGMLLMREGQPLALEPTLEVKPKE
jgi:S1-C subfamily serine protease